MDAVITTLIGAAPQLGVGGILLTLLGILIRRETQDRGDYRQQIADQQTRHDTELKRDNDSHDADVAELRKEIAGLRQQISDLNQRLDAERDRRRAAEDSAMGMQQRRERGELP